MKRLRQFSLYDRGLWWGIFLLGSAIHTSRLMIDHRAIPDRGGGLFAEFARQIAQHHFVLPRTIEHYFAGGIPYAYPPLPFYVAAFLTDVLTIPRPLVVDFLPPLITILTLVAFS